MSTDLLRRIYEQDRNVISAESAAELARLVGGEPPERGIRADLKRGAARLGRLLRPYANAGSLGLALMTSAAWTLGLAAGLLAAGVAVIIAEWNAER